MPDFKKEWMQKASVEYFSSFIALWLACNSWYRSHYSDVAGGDRACINKIKSDFSRRNHLFTQFSDLINRNDKEGFAFRTNIELLHYSLVRADLRPQNIERCSLNFAVIDYDSRIIENLVIRPRINQDGSVHALDKDLVIILDQIYISSDIQKVFAGIFEIIYQVRNVLVHGNLNPESEQHEVVKYCYLILWDLMSF